MTRDNKYVGVFYESFSLAVPSGKIQSAPVYFTESQVTQVTL